MRDPNKYTVTALKMMLEQHGLSAAGTKAELINRLIEIDPDGEWLRDDSDGSRDQRDDAEGASRTDAPSMQQTLKAQQREIELCKRERELVEHELELARREIELLRQNQMRERATINESQYTADNNNVRARSVQTKVNVAAIADLLSNFDGKSANYDTWERQIRLLKTIYQLEDDSAKLVIGMRLKGRALEWLHSRRHISGCRLMPFSMHCETCFSVAGPK